MNIALCLIGFIRNEKNIYNIIKFFNNINTPELKKMTVYYNCPSKIEETDDNAFDKNYILNLFKNQENEKLEIIISFRDYDKQKYIDYANELNLNHITRFNFHSFRLLSFLNSISETTKMIDNEKFNFIIFSRLDILNYILSINKIFDNNLVLYNSAYIWRTHPYISIGENAYHVEDRFFICSNECIDILKDLFLLLKNENIEKYIKNGFGSEEILGKIFNMYENIQKYHLYNMEISNDINQYTRQRYTIKYSKEFLNNN
jgi:hypothetical protein